MGLFCSASVRPKICKLSTNLCCTTCNEREECTTLNKSAEDNVCVPCQVDENCEDEPCPFSI